MPLKHDRASVKLNRSYSWPPSLQLIDVENIKVPLPDIDEDPWAHFMEQVSSSSDDTDDFLANAGIVQSEPHVVLAEKATKFRASISERWKFFYNKYLRRCRRSSKFNKKNPQQQTLPDKEIISPTLTFQNADSHKLLDKRPFISPFQATLASLTMRMRPQTELTAKQVQLIYRHVNGYSKPPRRTPADRNQRRSWTSPAVWLYPITEQSDEERVLNTNLGDNIDSDLLDQ